MDPEKAEAMAGTDSYGASPEQIGEFALDDWHEYMHFMYLPVLMPGDPHLRLPQRLEFLRPMIERCIDREWPVNGMRGHEYVYVCARRGFATPGNPLNRPGWHSDGFGSDDVNYVWTDRFPTLFALGDFGPISEDHNVSIEQFEKRVLNPDIDVVTYPDRMLLRLDPSVIHAAPEIPAPGGERGFIKVSFSNSKYNLRGNSHNHLFDYVWTMHDRAALRNDPAYSGGDAGPQEADDAA